MAIGHAPQHTTGRAGKVACDGGRREESCATPRKGCAGSQCGVRAAFLSGSLAVPLGAYLAWLLALVPAAASKLAEKPRDTSYAEARHVRLRPGRVLQQLAIGSVPSSLMSAREAAAWERVDGILATGDGDGVKLSAMLAVLPMHVTEGSSAQRTLAESAWASGLPPHPHAFNTMLSQLQLEAHGAEALAALQAEMSRMGVEANAETRDVLMRSENELEKLHGYELCRLLRWGRRQDHDGQPAVSTTAAWDLWRGCSERVGEASPLGRCWRMVAFTLTSGRLMVATSKWRVRMRPSTLPSSPAFARRSAAGADRRTARADGADLWWCAK